MYISLTRTDLSLHVTNIYMSGVYSIQCYMYTMYWHVDSIFTIHYYISVDNAQLPIKMYFYSTL